MCNSRNLCLLTMIDKSKMKMSSKDAFIWKKRVKKRFLLYFVFYSRDYSYLCIPKVPTPVKPCRERLSNLQKEFMYINSRTVNQVPATLKVGDAVGVPSRKWFVAIVGRNTEKASREKLKNLGYESYVATQNELRVWRTGQKKQVERVLISTLIFIHATEQERRDIVNLPFIKYFLTDKAGIPNDFGRHPLAVIPDHQMEMLRFMLYNADNPVNFTAEPLHVNDHIRVLRGPLAGFEGKVLHQGRRAYLVVTLDLLGSAMTEISADDLEKIA